MVCVLLGVPLKIQDELRLQTLVCSQRCRGLEEKRKRFASGQVDQPLKVKIYVKGFAVND